MTGSRFTLCPMPAKTDSRAALLSLVLPGLGQFSQGRIPDAFVAFLIAATLLALNIWLGRITDRAVEVLSFRDC
jgi:hypothetical protein